MSCSMTNMCFLCCLKDFKAKKKNQFKQLLKYNLYLTARLSLKYTDRTPREWPTNFPFSAIIHIHIHIHIYMYIYIYRYIYIYIYIYIQIQIQIQIHIHTVYEWATTKQACRDELVVYLSFFPYIHIYI